MASATSAPRPSTPPASRRPLNAPILSPSRMPAQRLSSYKNTGVHPDVFSPVDQNGAFCFDRVIKSGKVQRRTKSKGAWKASWKPAYLVLRPGLLSIYKNSDETDLRLAISLSDINAVARVQKSRSENVFGVFSPAKNHHFKCLSDRETSDWVTQIRLEARSSDDLESLDPPDPAFSRERGNSNLSTGFETTDLSADDSPEAPGSPTAPTWSVKGRTQPPNHTQSKPPTTHPPTTTATSYPYATADGNTTSVSSFSDFAPGSLPKHTPNNPILVPNPLSPIPSSQQLRPPLGQRNTSQLSITADLLASSPDRVLRQGWLQILRQKPGGLKSWKSLWVVLRPKSLSFYKNEQEYSAVKILEISRVIDAAEIDYPSKSKLYCFQVIGEDKTWRFCADGEEALAKWVGSLKSVLMRRDEMRAARGKDKVSGIVGATQNMALR